MATTGIHESYQSFCNRADGEDNGISIGTLMGHYGGDMEAALADGASNSGCWECTGCRNSHGCSHGRGLSDESDRHGACAGHEDEEEWDDEEDDAA